MISAGVRRFVVALVVLSLVLVARPTSADGWCRIDPIVRVDGQEASIYIVTQADSTARAHSYANVLVEYPWQSQGELVWVDPNHGFGYGFGVQVVPSDSLSYPAGGIGIRISVMVATGQNDQPVMVEWAPGPEGSATYASVIGTTNSWIVLDTVLPTS